MQYLNGTHHPVNRESLKQLIGKRVTYLRSGDIDKADRSYYIPRYGIVDGVKGRDVIIDGNYISINSLKEIVTDEK